MGSSAHGATELWRWAKLNWGKIEDALPAKMQAIILGLVLDGLNTESQIGDVRGFFAGRDTVAYNQALDQKLEGMEVRMRWAKRDIDDVKAWLEAHGYLDRGLGRTQ